MKNWIWIAFAVLLLSACGNSKATPPNNGNLQVVATTSIIGDVVAAIGGDHITLTTLIRPGQDPHAFEPKPSDLIAIEDAGIIFINGFGLDDRLISNVAAVDKVVSVSAEIIPRIVAGQPDPHVWLNVANVRAWTQAITAELSRQDPDHAADYEAAQSSYLIQLDELDADIRAQMETVSAETRKLVTGHDALGYFADTYGLTVIGSVIPSMSTGAEPSAGELASLIDTLRREKICTLFTEAEQDDSLAQALIADLDHCQAVKIIPLHIDFIAQNSSYLDMMRDNSQKIAEGLQ